jgi:DNA-binding GntR family transcriptional regulator
MSMTPAGERAATKQMLSERAYERIRADILRGAFGPGDALKPQELADALGVSLAVMREALLRLVGEGLADRLPNRGFAVPQCSDARWQQLGEARRVLEPTMLRMAIERGDVEWEARVRAAHHRLSRTAPYADGERPHYSAAWAAAHHGFHRALLEGCANPVLLETFERLWTATELARRWAGSRTPDRDHAAEHRRLEEVALARQADAAVEALAHHVSETAATLAPDN